MSCETCKSKITPESVPYIVHESAMVRNERNMKRLIIALVLAVAMIFASNAAWLYAWCQYDYYSEEVVVDSSGGGNANYIGQDGDIYNGTSDSEEKTQIP